METKMIAGTNRIAVNLKDLNLGLFEATTLSYLETCGIKKIHVDVKELVEACLGATYRKGSRISEAPGSFDCASFTKWVYSQIGFWLPRRAVQQAELGFEVEPCDIKTGDLIFTSGLSPRFSKKLQKNVGHAVFVLDKDWSVHAPRKESGVVKVPTYTILESPKLSIIKRFAQNLDEFITLECPLSREIESADDIKWIIYDFINGRLKTLQKGAP